MSKLSNRSVPSAVSKVNRPAVLPSTEIVFLLDRSGSMSNNDKWVEAVLGINALVADQTKLAGDAFLTLVVFDRHAKEPIIQIVHDHVPLKDVPELDPKGPIQPRSETPLWDAIYATIQHVRGKRAAMPATQRPKLVALNIFTDGLNNASTEITGSKGIALLRKMIAECEAEGWQVSFAGAGGGDIFAQAAEIGINLVVAVAGTARGVEDSMSQTTSHIGNYRKSHGISGGSSGGKKKPN